MMAVFPPTLHLLAPLWLAVPAPAPKGCDPTTVILRAVEESVTATGKPRESALTRAERSGQDQARYHGAGTYGPS